MKLNISIKSKLVMSLSAVAVVLVISCVISIREYNNINSYVTTLIAKDINNINTARKLGDICNTFNLDILAVIGDETLVDLPEFDAVAFLASCDSLRNSLSYNVFSPLADSVAYSYSAYMLTSMELVNVLQSDFIDTRTWYFERLQPRFYRLRSDIDAMSSAIYRDLEKNSEIFDRGLYRSVIPVMVTIGVGLLLLGMLLFFICEYYVDPLGRMLGDLKGYRTLDKKYNVKFEGDDELIELNDDISELVLENQQLRSRIKAMRNTQDNKDR